jgi:hypothetical protein
MDSFGLRQKSRFHIYQKEMHGIGAIPQESLERVDQFVDIEIPGLQMVRGVLICPLCL